MPKEEPSRNNFFILAKCEPFYGYSTENAAKLLSALRSYCTLQNRIDDKRTIAAFHLHLRGPALIWFNTLNESKIILWTVLQGAFQNRYISRDISDPSIIAESAIFDALTLHPTMAIETFHGEVLEKGSFSLCSSLSSEIFRPRSVVYLSTTVRLNILAREFPWFSNGKLWVTFVF